MSDSNWSTSAHCHIVSYCREKHEENHKPMLHEVSFDLGKGSLIIKIHEVKGQH